MSPNSLKTKLPVPLKLVPAICEDSDEIIVKVEYYIYNK